MNLREILHRAIPVIIAFAVSKFIYNRLNNKMPAFRHIAKSMRNKAQAEGAGATVYRSIGSFELRHIDPFLLLDEFHVKPPAGFPDHPHRGFETVTYMLSGAFEHEDFAGHRGTIKAGDLQWMTAGRGIVHAEMPATKNENIGLQLWVNLPKDKKMIEPTYQELLDKNIPRVKPSDGVEIKVIAGTSFGVNSPVRTQTPIMYLDISMDANKMVEQAVPEEYNGFIYVLEGSGTFGANNETTDAHTTLVFSAGDTIQIKTETSSVRFVLIAGKPIHEPIVQRGPFVMNTQEEIIQAMRDYQSNSFGFERARDFRSKISQR